MTGLPATTQSGPNVHPIGHHPDQLNKRRWDQPLPPKPPRHRWGKYVTNVKSCTTGIAGMQQKSTLP